MTKKFIRSVALLTLVSLTLPAKSPTLVWGFFGHRKINRQAVFILPPEMMYFFKKHIDYLTDHAVDADKRRYIGRFEAVRHYIDLDVHGKMPFDNLPRNWTEALIRHSDFYFVNEKLDTVPLFRTDFSNMPPDSLNALEWNPALTGNISQPKIAYRDFRRFFNKYFLPNYYEDVWTAPCDSLGAFFGLQTADLDCSTLVAVDHLSEHGILPWHLQTMLRRLTQAFRDRDPAKILRHAADIGHYIGDAHVPLHTTENYNGQLTGQNGIHAFWESRIPELFAEEKYDTWTGKAQFIDNPEDYFWKMVLESHTLVDSVLGIELDLRRTFPTDLQTCQEMRGNALIRTQCTDFADAYDRRMGGMVERRMKESILSVGSAWYTAWVMAGQPDMKNIEAETLETDSLGIGESPGRKKFSLFRAHE